MSRGRKARKHGRVSSDRAVSTETVGGVRELLGSVVVGILVGGMAIVFAISFSAIVFSGPLAPYLPQGIGIGLFSAVVLNAVGAFGSSFRGVVTPPQDMTAAILALAVGQFALRPELSGPNAPLFQTAVAMLAVTALAAGIALLLLGRFRLGMLVRFIPYPVVGGFMAATGWLLIRGATTFMTGVPIHFGTVVTLFEQHRLVAWVPGALLGVVMLIASRRLSHPATLPAVLLLGGVVFYVVAMGTGHSPAEVEARGLLIGPFPPAGIWRPPTPALLEAADWAAIAAAWPLLASTVALTVVGLLLNATGIEYATHREVDLDRELQAAGAANIVVAAGGGLIGFQGLGLTVIADRLGGRDRRVGLVIALLSAAALFFGAGVLSFVPRMLVGGVTIFIGLDFLLTWLVDTRRRLPPEESLIVLLIFVTSALVGFLEGVAVGLFAGFVLFVVSYSRAGIIRHRLSRASFRSNVDRPAADEQRLLDHGAAIRILVLEGYMFFGTAHRLLTEIEAMAATGQGEMRYLVLDLSLVSGIDSSAVHSFEKLRRLAEAHRFTLVLCGVSPAVLDKLWRGAGGGELSMVLQPDLDHAVEWCERRLLEAEPGWSDAPGEALETCLAREFAEADLARKVAAYFEPLSAEDGAVLIQSGSEGRELYFIEAGRLAAYDDAGGMRRRLRSILAGNVVGEVGLYLGAPRTATVVAEGAVRLQRLDADAMVRMEREQPAAVAELHKFVLRRTVRRLGDANRLVRALSH